MRVPRFYADTSVFGGCFDEEFSEPSRALFEHILQGTFRLIVSDTLLLELQDAPQRVRDILFSIPIGVMERVELLVEVERLRDAYIAVGVVGPASLRDAEHIAAATVADVDMIVSWNFTHIVHFEKISGYQGVNLVYGYRAVRIFSPREVI